MSDVGTPSASPVSASPPLSPAEEKQWAMLTHVLGIVFGAISAIVLYGLFRDRGPFIKHHVTTQLNFQLMLIIVFVLGLVASFASIVFAVISPADGQETSGVLFSFFFFPFGVSLLVGAINLILGFCAALSAIFGMRFSYPAFRFVK